MKKFLSLLVAIIFSNYLSSQTYSTGAVFLSNSEYAQLPRPNWDTLAKYSTRNSIRQSNTIANSGNGITMLVSPPIGNQGGQGSCVGWAVGYTAMGILTYPKYYCWSAALRSPAYVYNQIKILSDCYSGSHIKDAANLAISQGVCALSLMPYVETNCSTQPNSTQQNDAAQNKSVDWYALDATDVEGIKRALDLGFPVVNGYEVTSSFDQMWVNGGNWNSNEVSGSYRHATCIIGYDDSKQMFKVQNQWGTAGGDNGYYWVTYDLVRNNCMKELYIIYGRNSSNFPTINGGTDAICNSSNFSINNLPSNVSVTWSVIPSNAASLSCTNCSQPTITQQSNYYATIQATLTDNCTGETSSLYKKVTLGTGGSINYTLKQISCENNKHYFWGAVEPRPLNTNYDWYVKDESNPNNPFILKESGVSNAVDFPLGNGNSDKYYTIKVLATNTCGTKQSILEEGLIYAYACGSGGGELRLMASPNPINDNVSVEITSDDIAKGIAKKEKIYEIQIHNKLGVCKKTLKYTEGIDKVSVQINSLESDIYVLRAYNGKQWIAKQIIKK
jgi:hypothetical protein